MWRTESGERVLEGAEWELFREGMDCLWDDVEEQFHAETCDEALTGVPVFDRLQPNQKLAMLALVGKALSSQDEPAPDLTAVSEGTVAAVFEYILNLTKMEIDMEDDVRNDPDGEIDPTALRRAILASSRQCLQTTEGELPAETSRKDDDWDFLIELLSGRILWDDGDYLMEANFLDLPPDAARKRMEQMGIDPDYYMELPPDPPDSELTEIRWQLAALCGRHRYPPRATE